MNTSQLIPFAELASRIAPKKLSEVSLVSILPLLEYAFPFDQHDAESAFQKASIIGTDEKLPLEKLVSFAVQSDSSYWATLAVEWMIAGFPISDDLRAHLMLLMKRTNVPQSLQHKAQVALKMKMTNKPWMATPTSPFV